MNNIGLDEMAALRLVLNNVTVKDLLHGAMQGFSSDQSTQSQSNADICSQAIIAFLR